MLEHPDANTAAASANRDGVHSYGASTTHIARPELRAGPVARRLIRPSRSVSIQGGAVRRCCENRRRYLVEIFFHNLKRFRAIATRYEKTARNYLALVQVACAWLWLS